MVGKLSFIQASTLLSAALVGASPTQPILQTCKAIAAAISSASDVYYPGSANYTNDIAHWAASSSATSVCSVEPGSTKDVGKILTIIGATRTPFGIKGGGHAFNPGFSSSTGIQIAMTRFSNVTYNAASHTADIGAGLVWDQVYEILEPYNVNVVGGRTVGVGVAGFTLGGGYSWKTNQHGLTIDTVQAFELVFPNGTLTTVTAASNPDLFFGLKGGFNNFGIVTKFTLKTFPQTQVWGGSVTITEDNIDAFNAAVANYSASVQDPKAAAIASYFSTNGTLSMVLLAFYDAPTYPDGIFDQLMAVPSASKDVSTRSFISFIQSSTGLTKMPGNLRCIDNTVSILTVTPALLNATVNQAKSWGQQLANITNASISYDVEPFLPSIFSHGSPSAFPPNRSRGLLPYEIFYSWTSEESDNVMQQANRQSADMILQAAVQEGQQVANAAVYPNYASAQTPVKNIYGANLPRLSALNVAIDPKNVMGLTGGFKF